MNYNKLSLLFICSVNLIFFEIETFQHFRKLNGGRVADLMIGTAVCTLGAKVYYREQEDRQRYVHACADKMNLDDKFLKSLDASLAKCETANSHVASVSSYSPAAPLFSLVIQILLFLDKAPVKLGRTPILVDNEVQNNSAVLHPCVSINDAEVSQFSSSKRYLRKTNVKLVLSNYSFIISRNIYDSAYQAFNPLHCLLYPTVKHDLATDSGSPYRLEMEVQNSLMRDYLGSIVSHEGMHAKEHVFKQVISGPSITTPGVDITTRENELIADSGIQRQEWIRGALLYHNVALLRNRYENINGIADLANIVSGGGLVGMVIGEITKAVAPHIDSLLKGGEMGRKAADDFLTEFIGDGISSVHPYCETRIKELEKRLETRGNRRAIIRVYDKCTGELNKTIVLEEEENFKVPH